MHRRAWLLGSVALWARWPKAHAQSEPRPLRVGELRPGNPPLPDDQQNALLLAALRELGYVAGRNLQLEHRYANGDPRQLPALARDLVAVACDVVLAVGGPAVKAMKQASSTLPIVMFGNFDPVALGLVDNLARPGGNVTGVLIAPDGTLAGKRLELLKQAVPQATRIGLLIPPDDESVHQQVLETRTAAKALGIELRVVPVRDGDYAAAFAALARERVAALVVGSHQYFFRDRRRVVELAATHRLPAMYEWDEQVAAGGLMAYSTSRHGLYQRIAAYMDRIHRGAKPSELPVERPTKFELVINLKAARAIDLVVPQSLLLRADEVIE